MSSNDVKEQLVEWYGGNISDWKRKTKIKKGFYDVRTFENKILNLTKTVVSCDNDEDNIKPEYFPTGEFWIYVNQKDLDTNNIDESKSYFDSNNTDPLTFDEYTSTSVSTMLVLKNPRSDAWYDQHCGRLIEDYFGVKDFTKIFYEDCENMNMLTKPVTVGDVKTMCENAGMKFLGYRNIINGDW